jgi:hypothetical protein
MEMNIWFDVPAVTIREAAPAIDTTETGGPQNRSGDMVKNLLLLPATQSLTDTAYWLVCVRLLVL